MKPDSSLDLIGITCMKYLYKHYIILFVILLVAIFSRVYKISTNPPAISWDEASIGYNAYTILTTGKDEHGVFLPLDTFAAFGDYKPPVPIYLTVPFVALFGLSELAVRLPSAIAGVFSVYMLFLLVSELFKSSKHAQKIALVSAALLTITPWHIMLSRAGFEANIALLFLITGVYLVLKVRTNPTLLYICWLPFVLGVYTFNSTRYAGPMIAAALFVLIYKHILQAKKQAIGGILIALVVLLPIVPHLFSKQARLRFEEVSIFTDLRTVLISNARQQVDKLAPWSAVLHNRRVGYAREYFIHFFDNLEPRYLFIKGDGNPKFSIQDVGQLLLVSAPFVVYGWLTLFRDYSNVGWLLVWWLVAAIAPTAVARETPHALRTENGLPVYMIVTAYGFVMALVRIKKYHVRAVLFVMGCVLFAGNFAFFWHNLMTHYPKEYSGEWQYGYKQAIELASKYKNDYDTIVLTESIGRPYIYALFYEKISLSEFEKTRDASFDDAGFYNVYRLGKYRFTRQGTGDYKGKTLYILPPKDVLPSSRVIETIRVLNGTSILVAFE